MSEFHRPNESDSQLIDRCTNLSQFDCTEKEMLWLMMGPRTLPLQKLIPISVILCSIFLTGVAGNVAVCVVIIRHPVMHTATNYYLFSLALSDLLLLLFGKFLQICKSIELLTHNIVLLLIYIYNFFLCKKGVTEFYCLHLEYYDALPSHPIGSVLFL